MKNRGSLPPGYGQQTVKNFEDRLVNVIVNAGDGAVIISPLNSALTLVSMTIQVSADCVIQLYQNGQPVTVAYRLKAGMIWSLPSRFIANNSTIILRITAGSANVETLVRPGIHPEDLRNHENSFYEVPDALLATFAVGAQSAVPASGTASTWVMYGSASKIIKISRIVVSVVGNIAASGFECLLRKFSSLPTGGTATNLLGNITKLDSGDAASTVSLLQNYSVAPVDGVSAGVVLNWRTIFPSATAPAQGSVDVREMLFGNVLGRKALFLNNANEGIGFQFSNTNLNYTVDAEWTEN